MADNLEDGLIHYWSHNESGNGAIQRADDVGSKPLATSGSHFNVSAATGFRNNASQTYDFVSLYTGNSLGISLPCTVDGWIKQTTGSGTTVWPFEFGSAGNSVECNPSYSPDNYRFKVERPGTPGSVFADFTVSTDSIWRYFCVRILADESIVCNLDGTQQTIAAGGTGFGTFDGFRLGQVFSGGVSLHDETAIWDRALSDDEVAWRYAAGAGNFRESGVWTGGAFDPSWFPTNGSSEWNSAGLDVPVSGGSEWTSEGLDSPENGSSEWAAAGLEGPFSSASVWNADALDAPTNGGCSWESDGLSGPVNGASVWNADTLDAPTNGSCEWDSNGIGGIESAVSEWNSDSLDAPNNGGCEWSTDGLDVPDNGASEWSSGGLEAPVNGGCEWLTEGLDAPTNGASEWDSDGVESPQNGASEWDAEPIDVPQNGGAVWRGAEINSPQNGVSEWRSTPLQKPLTNGGCEWAALPLIVVINGGCEWTSEGPFDGIEPNHLASLWLSDRMSDRNFKKTVVANFKTKQASLANVRA